MGKFNVHPAIIAATIAGGGIGTVTGFMTQGEKLEEQGATGMQQLTGSVGSGLKDGVIGAGIGVGASSTVYALKKVLGK